MKSGKIKISLIAMLAAIAIFAIVAGMLSMNNTAARADGSAYGESYRNQLSYSAERGWNNDPNGLLYVDGTYHLYYQYTWDERNHSTASWWDHMSWGHATSNDLVHWTEKPVAIPSYWDNDGVEHMMFSGSAVYDEYNTSGLFETENGKVKDGQGIVAVLTQPSDKDGGQRQILAYSKDGGTSFEIHGEILGANAEGSLNDGEFRDPKVFWNAELNKWLMAVGGGSVRMYSSDNLTEWKYLGETGFWGECPDISRFEVGGEEKYVLVISPEDKIKSHRYNGTNRVDTYYPAEYYVVGDLDENGLFRATQPLKRLSEGIDCYAFQSFNNVPNGKVYGISWSASWLTVGAYEGYRGSFNGGMTVACELQLVNEGNEYTILRKPVEGFNDLRNGEIASVSQTVEKGVNPLANVKATEADIELELDFNSGDAKIAELSLRVSAEEKIVIAYDKETGILSLDRSGSSLIAENTNFFKDVYKKSVPLTDGKLSLRILLDRAFITVFANGGYASFFSAVFPSAISDGMSLISDGAIGVNAKIYAVESIFGNIQSSGFIVTTDKLDVTAGSTHAVIASSYSKNFNSQDVVYTVTEGSANISLEVKDGTAYIKALNKGSAKVKAAYGEAEKFIEVYIYNDGFTSDVNFTDRYRAFTFIREDGLFLGAGTVDAFLFGDKEGTDFTYSATFTPQANAQAGGLAFGYIGNPSGYWFVTADVTENKIKLVEFRGEKEAAYTLQTAAYEFTSASYKLTATLSGGTVKVYADDKTTAEIICKLENYKGGRVGLNVYNSDMVVNNVVFASADNGSGIAVGEDIVKVINVTDKSYKLKDGEYAVADGKLTISESYLKTLENDTEYTFRVVTETTDFDAVVKTNFEAATLTPAKSGFTKGEDISFTVSGGAQVYKLEINGVECEFTVDGDKITVSSETLKDFTSGTHKVKAYTASGRPSADFKLTGLPDFVEETEEITDRTFFWIDIAVFAALIIGYVAFTVFKKFRKQAVSKKQA